MCGAWFTFYLFSLVKMHTCKAPVMRRSHRAYSPDTRRNIPFCQRILAGTVAGKVDGEGTAGRFGRPGSAVMADGGRRAVAGGRLVGGGRLSTGGGQWTEDGSKGAVFTCVRKLPKAQETSQRTYIKGVSITHNCSV